jgi:hypothetical protein
LLLDLAASEGFHLGRSYARHMTETRLTTELSINIGGVLTGQRHGYGEPL